MSEQMTPPRLLGRDELARLVGFALTDEQWECVCAPMQPVVIVAGAGTGKTTVMAARVLWLVASGLVDQSEVLGLTFTNRAAGELAARVEELLRRWWDRGGPAHLQGAQRPTVSTYHSFAASLLEEHGLRLGMEPGARLLTATASAQLTHGVVVRAEHLPSWTSEPPVVTSAVMRLDANLAEQAIATAQLREHDRAVIAELDGAGNGTAASREVRSTAQRRLELTALVETARVARAQAGGLDFTDQMRLCVDVVCGSDDVVRRVRARYRLVLLDEYQDTSIAQRMILSRLFAGASVTAVGDPLQAIYGWRSASVANIAAFAEHFGVDHLAASQSGSAAKAGAQAGMQAGAMMRTLTQNRRSASLILDAANQVATPLRRTHPEVRALVASTEQPGVVRVSLHEDLAQELAWIGDMVCDLVARGQDPTGIAILARTNADLAGIWSTLRARRVPAVVCAAEALTATPFAAHLVAMLRVLVDPGDDAAVVAVLGSGRWEVCAADLARLAARARELAARQADRAFAQPVTPQGSDPRSGDPAPAQDGGTSPGAGGQERSPGAAARLRATLARDPVGRPSLMAAVANPGGAFSPATRARLRRFHRQWCALSASLDLPLPELLHAVISASGVGIEAALASGSGVEADPALAGLLDLAVGFRDGQGRTSAQAFVAYLNASEELGTPEGVEATIRPGAVQLMTVHKSKGLEFPVVLLPHLCAGAFPASRPSPRWTTSPHVVPVELRDDRSVLPALTGLTGVDLKQFVVQCREHDRSGEDRLAYVAVTRAKRMLIASGHWWGETQRRPRGPSDYLFALRGVATQIDHWAPAPSQDDVVARQAHQPRETRWPVPAPDSSTAQVAALVRARRTPGDTGIGGDPDLTDLTPSEHEQYDAVVGRWDRSVAAARSTDEAGSWLPDVLSATQVMELVRSPGRFTESLRRPMPRRRSPEAEVGTAFHAWVQSRWGAEQLVLDDEWLDDAGEWPVAREELAELRAAFERTPYAARVPVALEVPFHLSIGGRGVRGRIDAIFVADPDAAQGISWEVVDWKTSTSERGDPLQLAVYRLAWAAMRGVPVEHIGASFVHVRTGLVERHRDLPDAVGVAELITRRARAATDRGSPRRGRNGH